MRAIKNCVRMDDPLTSSAGGYWDRLARLASAARHGDGQSGELDELERIRSWPEETWPAGRRLWCQRRSSSRSSGPISKCFQRRTGSAAMCIFCAMRWTTCPAKSPTIASLNCAAFTRDPASERDQKRPLGLPPASRIGQALSPSRIRHCVRRSRPPRGVRAWACIASAKPSISQRFSRTFLLCVCEQYLSP
jgi:hypothetical protein